MFPFSEGAWICKRHKQAIKPGDRGGSSCFRCIKDERDSLAAENKWLREALKETIHRLRWVNYSSDESALVNRSIEQAEQALAAQ